MLTWHKVDFNSTTLSGYVAQDVEVIPGRRLPASQVVLASPFINHMSRRGRGERMSVCLGGGLLIARFHRRKKKEDA